MRIRPVLTPVLLALMAARCSDPSGPGDVSPPSSPNAVDVRDNFYNLASTTVPVGTTVTWTWRGGNSHDVSFADGVASPVQSSGTYARQFTSAGTYTYICTVHGSAMSGRVIVQ